ncbi:hypothetical protein SASPL_140373 [Salvia splendens]|uniref:Multidrug and toxic compound extrusion protein n=1 Tax=Salvia splendens TaxID=180675 RepID=A0A8X8WPW0_SALSN|nr:hypothetical protein SASPL_140373 [Salvia splendens]
MGEEGSKPLIDHDQDQDQDFMEEVKHQLRLAVSLITVNILLYCLQVISLMFVGHLGELQLSGASVATSFAAVSGFSVLLGMGSALETLCGQAYGAKQYQMLSVYTQRGVVVVLALSVGLAVVWYNTSFILVGLGQDHDISAEAGVFNSWMIPSLFAYGILQCLIRFLQTQNIVLPMVVTSAATSVFHVFLCWLLVFKLEFGSRGAAMATVALYWINVVLLALYVNFSSACAECFTGFSREAFHDIVGFLRLAVPSALMICLEYWSFEMVVLLSGLLPNPTLETSVLSRSLNTCWMVYMISVGLGGAVSTRVSNELGAGNAVRARLAVYVAAAIAASEGVVIGAITVLCVLSGAARGCGWQTLCAVINLGAYYVVAIPCPVLLAFVFHLGGMGLWTGIICGLLVQAVVLIVINTRTNWDDEVTKAVNRVQAT